MTSREAKSFFFSVPISRREITKQRRNNNFKEKLTEVKMKEIKNFFLELKKAHPNIKFNVFVSYCLNIETNSGDRCY